MKKVLINGRFLTQRITGVQRYAYEMLKAFDEHLDKKEYKAKIQIDVLTPRSYKSNNIELKNIKIKKFGILKGHLWEQIELPLYAKIKGYILLNLCNTAPILKTDYVVIHDISFKINPSFFSKSFRVWYLFLMTFIMNNAKKIITPSDFSKKEILKNYKLEKDKIFVIYEGYEHIDRIIEDNKIMKKLELKEKDFFLAVGSLNPNKNFEFIINIAKKFKNEKFVIVGGINKKIFSKEKYNFKLDNIIYAGYISDSELKSLYKNCKAFIFPSFYEGFGLPPLEALSCGTNIIVSDTSSLKEIYKDVAEFIDPKNINTFSKNFKEISDEQRKNFLKKFSWRKNSEIFLNYLINY
ncbi:glycosyltransferase family 1 protein [Marinitoga sp. 1138]|uniref:glycosyltransferase family 4 protein n=1 Tax=Marinitoga sp. 1138 TaxID=1643334 RepID=UPI001586D2B2|nr:glycosyltransferase family 1 protein [Marinitoga sp. 1138]NUU97737.1 hypothetical protein [Marinitoga sp. 1138]